MHGIELLHNWLSSACSFMHAARARTLVKVKLFQPTFYIRNSRIHKKNTQCVFPSFRINRIITWESIFLAFSFI